MGRINEKKYENVILYLCNRLGGSIFGKKKLAKLLYYVDFDHFEYKESMKSITGDTYQAWKMGPVPENYTNVISKMQKENKLKTKRIKNSLGLNPTEVFIAEKQADESSFTEDERFILDRVISKYGGLSGKELEILTHQEAPYVATENSQIISYELAFYRGTDFNELARA